MFRPEAISVRFWDQDHFKNQFYLLRNSTGLLLFKQRLKATFAADLSNEPAIRKYSHQLEMILWLLSHFGGASYATYKYKNNSA